MSSSWVTCSSYRNESWALNLVRQTRTKLYANLTCRYPAPLQRDHIGNPQLPSKDTIQEILSHSYEENKIVGHNDITW